ncbi:hypothetical protein T492DRAFT_1014023 [Pavlovales sp. CCMP2436]|nr:hypothetical protein T492DRAFT_1014023 [Pavlovales sp. CCMP2436]|mmetsp:Transcript_234/g.628  ORF Transcript_234/g.628 Transcript_234/m.628 type:complete len:220 (-) Transcript_234:177-836(-)
MATLSQAARSGVRELVARMGEEGTELEICRAVETEAQLLRAEHAMVAAMARDDLELGLGKFGVLTARGRRLRDMVRVRVHEDQESGDGKTHRRVIVDLEGLRVPVALHFQFSCSPDPKRKSWSVIYFVALAVSHGPARKLVVMRVKARQCYPCPENSDDTRVVISGARLERLSRLLKLGLDPREVLMLVMAFDHFDEQWDVANVVLDAADADDGDEDAS